MTLFACLKMGGLLVAYGLVWLLCFDGAANAIVHDATPKVVRYQEGGNRAVLSFTGTQSSGVAHSAPVRDVWEEHADDVVVEYNPKRFDAATIIKTTYEQMLAWGYKIVLLDGASLGAMLVTDFIDYDRAHGGHMQFVVVLQDGPTTVNDLVQATPAKLIAKLWRAGPAANTLFTRLFWFFGFNPPSRTSLGAGVNDEQLARHYHASKTYALSGWTGELRYMATHRDYQDSEYAGIPLIVMRSHPVGAEGDDGVVKWSAANRWLKIFGGGQIIEIEGSTHIGFVEFPDIWRAAFRRVFAMIGW